MYHRSQTQVIRIKKSSFASPFSSNIRVISANVNHDQRKNRQRTLYQYHQNVQFQEISERCKVCITINRRKNHQKMVQKFCRTMVHLPHQVSLCPRGYGRTAFHLFEILQPLWPQPIFPWPVDFVWPSNMGNMLYDMDWYGYVMLIYRCFNQQRPKCWLMSSGSYYPNLHKLGISIVNWEILMKTTLFVFADVCFPVLPKSASWHVLSLSGCHGWHSSNSPWNLQACLEDHFTIFYC